MPFRIFLFILYMFMILFNAGARTYSSGYRGTNIFGYPDNNENLSTLISKKTRRILALHKCRKFIKKESKCYTLSNRYIIIIYNTEDKIIYCRDKTNKQNIANYDYIYQKTHDYQILKELFDESFDVILNSFNENTNYTDITNFLNQYFISDKKIQDERQKQIQKFAENTKKRKLPQFIDEYIEEQDKIIDINKANEEELSKLPGISVIIAKKIIKHRKTKGGFESIEEFYKEMKIKPHFQKQLNNLVYINPKTIEEPKPVIPNNNERIIDL